MPQMILMGPPNSEREPSASKTLPEPERLPLQTDLALHAAPALALIIDFYFLERKYPKFVSQYGSLILASALGTWYACWVEYCASYNGVCAYHVNSVIQVIRVLTVEVVPYPFLTYSPFNVRVAIYAGASLFAAVAFMVINALHP